MLLSLDERIASAFYGSRVKSLVIVRSKTRTIAGGTSISLTFDRHDLDTLKSVLCVVGVRAICLITSHSIIVSNG